jgi:hypothetical protein
MSDHSEAFVAFDSSKLRNAEAIADSGRMGEIRFQIQRRVFTQPRSKPEITALQHLCPLRFNQQTCRGDL